MRNISRKNRQKSGVASAFLVSCCCDWLVLVGCAALFSLFIRFGIVHELQCPIQTSPVCRVIIVCECAHKSFKSFYVPLFVLFPRQFHCLVLSQFITFSFVLLTVKRSVFHFRVLFKFSVVVCASAHKPFKSFVLFPVSFAVSFGQFYKKFFIVQKKQRIFFAVFVVG
jgi:hypothetical protein